MSGPGTPGPGPGPEPSGDQRPGIPRNRPGGEPGVPPRDTTILGATLLVMWGPFAWAGMGAGSYMAQAGLCAHDGPNPLPFLWGLTAVTLALTVTGFLAVKPLSRWLMGPDVDPGTAGFLIALSRAMGTFAVVGIVWLALVVYLLPGCPQLR